MAILIEHIAPKRNVSPQRADEIATSEGISQEQRVGPYPPVTTTTYPTAPGVIQTTPWKHQKNTRHNTPGIALAIKRQATNARKLPRLNPALVQNAQTFNAIPNSNRSPFFSHHNMISQENLLMQIVLDTPGKEWTPRDFFDHSPP